MRIFKDSSRNDEIALRIASDNFKAFKVLVVITALSFILSAIIDITKLALLLAN